MMTTLKTVTIAAGLLIVGTSLATAQYGGYPGYGYGYGGYGYAGLYDSAAPAYGYGGYGGYGAPAGTTVIIVTPSPGYAPGYGGGYGWGRAGYWGGYGYGWR
jgi:hypothetical protein